jgi:hypothetical protein
MGSIDGWVDPEIEAMQNMIHGAIDASFEDRNRAKEGARSLAGNGFCASPPDFTELCIPHICVAGLNSFGGTYYKGPSKAGSSVTFKLYALSKRLELPRGASRDEIVKAMKGKVLSELPYRSAPAHGSCAFECAFPTTEVLHDHPCR